MTIKQQAGKMQLVAFTDGSPVSVNLYVDGSVEPIRIGYEGLHDLRYIITRVIDKIDAAVPNLRYR